MKLIISVLLTMILFIQNTKCQTLALNTSKGKQEFTTYSPENFVAFRGRPAPPNAFIIAGSSSIGIGLVAALYGLVVQNDAYNAANETTNESEWQRGNTIIVAGCALTVAGIGMCIVGGIQHYKKYHRSRWGITTPKKNEVGLAYNF